ncbi:Polyenoic fatty acid isomerase [Mizuhopecten yessoensis]|uniref:Polyenoic fatty acid isomerase n=1 Tax=Mizuhopecten yessoensis TaxID=6573 RepID=A0A210QDD8_MIZYE|nr:Polyenoic fatty acid isomerase [Mizuhopecten yessoensis]
MGTLVMLMCILVGCFQAIGGMPPLERDLIELLEIARGRQHSTKNHRPSSSSSSSSASSSSSSSASSFSFSSSSSSASSSSEEEEVDISESGFPSISGPENFDDKIAIIGAGPAGIHMALKLKRAGFQNVIVFEKEDKVGGKSKTLTYRDVVHEMGTCYTQPDYTELYELLETYDAGNLIPVPGVTVWRGEVMIPGQVNTLIPVAQSLPENATVEDIQNAFLAAVNRYVTVHQQLFGNYSGELMPRPDENVFKKELNMTFLQFLEKYEAESLAQIFLQAHTIQGYGHLDEIPALYGLTWLTPNFLLKLLDPPPEEVSYIKLLSRGYQTVWEEIVRQENIDVRLSSPVRKIFRKGKKERGMRRKNRSEFTILYDNAYIYGRTEEFDFLILTPEMKLLSDLEIIDFNEEESALFEKMNHYYYATSLVDTTYGGRRGLTPQSYFADNVESKEDMKVWAKRDSYNSLVYNVGENYTKGLVPGAPDGKFIQTSVYYQFSKARPNETDLENELKTHIEDREEATVLNIRDVFIWDYFPQFSVADIASGITWDIFDIQGKHKIWYAGSSVYFESVKSVLEYNNLIFRQYRLPEEE